MRRLITSSLAALTLSFSAAAQHDWAYLVCLAEVVQETPDAEVTTSNEVHHFRFNAERAERFDEAAERWADDCVVGGEGYFGASQTVSDTEIRCIRAGTNAVGGELYYDRSIYLDTGRYTIADYSYEEGAATSRNAQGTCRMRRVPAPVKQP